MSYGAKFNIKDIERCGLFGEMSYMVGKGYTPQIWGATKIRDMKRSQMYPNYTKTKTGLQDCYFDTQFKRLFIGEKYESPYSRIRREEMESKKKNVGRAFVPSSPAKKQSCPGAFDATIGGGKVTAFSPLSKVVKPIQKKLWPMYPTSPAKKGGPGYTNICFSSYPKATAEIYDDPFVSAKDGKRQGARLAGFLAGTSSQPFDPNPWYTRQIAPTYKRVFDKLTTLHGAIYGPGVAREKGDSYHGGIGKYPEYIAPRKPKEKPKKEKRTPFYPQPRDKSYYTSSVVNRNIDIAVHSSNWKTVQPVTYTKQYL